MKKICAHHLLVPAALVFLCFASGCEAQTGTNDNTSNDSTTTPANDPAMTDPAMNDPAMSDPAITDPTAETFVDPNETPISRKIRLNKEAISKFTGDAKLVADRVIELDKAQSLDRPKDKDGFGLQPAPAAIGTFYGMVVKDGNLEEIHLPQQPVTDEDLALFSKVSSLKVLTLQYCLNLTDAGAEHLKKLTELKELNLKYTNISQEMIDQLTESLPGCEILYTPIP